MPLLSALQGLRRQRSGPATRSGTARRALQKTQSLQLPLSFAGRLAVLTPGFRLERGMVEFGAHDFEGISAFAPELIVAPLSAALALADRKHRGLIELSSVQFAIVVLTTINDDPLCDHHRDLLWRAFGVPVFEQLRDSDGQMVARECEVHDGMHLLGPEPAGAVDYSVARGECECGAQTPRLQFKPLLKTKATAAVA